MRSFIAISLSYTLRRSTNLRIPKVNWLQLETTILSVFDRQKAVTAAEYWHSIGRGMRPAGYEMTTLNIPACLRIHPLNKFLRLCPRMLVILILPQRSE
jgi:hypothetical protein